MEQHKGCESRLRCPADVISERSQEDESLSLIQSLSREAGKGRGKRGKHFDIFRRLGVRKRGPDKRKGGENERSCPHGTKEGLSSAACKRNATRVASVVVKMAELSL